MNEWTWALVGDDEWALFRDGERSRGRVVWTSGRYIGVWDDRPVVTEYSLEAAQDEVEAVTRSRIIQVLATDVTQAARPAAKG
ncbi:MAG TPA: hypothetical protein VNT27_03150 [Propionibacteriaceae bacterium]|nr:hypothetical protein [Propionibacteriaceae bacterium]